MLIVQFDWLPLLSFAWIVLWLHNIKSLCNIYHLNIIAYCCVITWYLTLKSFTIRIKFTIQCHKWGVHNCEWTMTEVILCFVCLLLTPSTHNHFFRHYGILCEKAVRVSLEKKKSLLLCVESKLSWAAVESNNSRLLLWVYNHK